MTMTSIGGVFLEKLRVTTNREEESLFPSSLLCGSLCDLRDSAVNVFRVRLTTEAQRTTEFTQRSHVAAQRSSRDEIVPVASA